MSMNMSAFINAIVLNYRIFLLIGVLIVCILIKYFMSNYLYNTENYQNWYGINTHDEPEHVSFTNHNLTKNPMISNSPDPTYEWFAHKPFNWKVKIVDDGLKHPLNPCKINPVNIDYDEGYETHCLRDYKCMINYINPENDIKK